MGCACDNLHFASQILNNYFARFPGGDFTRGHARPLLAKQGLFRRSHWSIRGTESAFIASERLPLLESAIKLVLPRMKTVLFSLVAFILSIIGSGITPAHAQAFLSFSGGNGSPLSFTLAQPVTYFVTTASAAEYAPGFVFNAVGNPFGNSFPVVAGSIVFTINGGAPYAVDTINSGATFGSATPNDIYFFSFDSLPGVSVGDFVTLTAGTLTTAGSVAGAAPPDGAYTTAVINAYCNPISTAGVTVPEPSTWALLMSGFLLLLGVVGRRRDARAVLAPSLESARRG